MPASGWRLFDDILEDDWHSATNGFGRLLLESDRSAATAPPPGQWKVQLDRVTTTVSGKLGISAPSTSALEAAPWHGLVDAYWPYVLAKTWRAESLQSAVQQMMDSVPAGAIFFGDSDVGRFGVGPAADLTGERRRFLVITQNQLSDPTYWDYVRNLTGPGLKLPTLQDYEPLFAEYQAGRYGPWKTAAEVINAKLSKLIFERNPDRPFYIEPTFYLPMWAYPHVVPRGAAFEINREPLAELPDHITQAERAFWSQRCAQVLGLSGDPDLSVQEVCDFVDRVYIRRQLEDFRGDAAHLGDLRSQDWLWAARHASARVYRWRCAEATLVSEKQRMLNECLLAYQQAFALSPALAFDFADVLEATGRIGDPLAVLEQSARFQPANLEKRSKVEEIRRRLEARAE